MVEPPSSRFRTFCWASLAFVVGVILWGAVVRATGSGAGCGSHWPMCNGEVVPPSPSTETLIELTHRVTSGLSAVAVFVALFWARRLYPRGHRVRHAAGWSSVFMVGEVLVGAALVLLKYVGDDASVGRAAVIALHLANTFLLLGAMTLLAHFASGAPGLRLRGERVFGGLALAAVGGTLLVGMSGAVAALGDTLFPAADLGTALAADLSATAHVLVRLRVIHPFVAVGVAFGLLALRHFVVARRPSPAVLRWGALLRAAVIAELGAGIVNLLLLAPVWMQIVHLLLADALWIALVLLLASTLAEQPESEPAGALAEPSAQVQAQSS
jgi:heme A synthase